MATIYVDGETVRRKKDQANQAAGRKNNSNIELQNAINELNRLKANPSAITSADLRNLEKHLKENKEILEDELAELREEFGRELGKRAVEEKRALEEVRRLAEANKKDVNAAIGQIKELQQKMDSEYNRFVKNIESKRKQALCYYDQIRGMIDEIKKLFPEKYEPLHSDVLRPNLYTLESSLGMISDDIRNGNHEAAIGVAQVYIPEAITIRGYLEVFHNAFLEAEKETTELLDNAGKQSQKLAKSATKEVTVQDGYVYKDTHSGQYWARELYEDLTRQLTSFEKRYGEYKEAHDTESLNALSVELQRLIECFAVCENIANNEMQLYYERREMIANAFDCINENDPNIWRYQDPDNALQEDEADLRGPTHITLVNDSGYHLVISCVPIRNEQSPEQMGTVSCRLETYDDGLQKDRVSICNTLYKQIELVLNCGGIVLDTKNSENKTADSQTLITQMISNEGAARKKWISSTKAVIGLRED